MSNEYKDWIEDKASSVADIMEDLYTTLPLILSWEAESQDSTETYNEIALIYDKVNNYIKDNCDIINRWKNRDFYTKDTELLNTLEDFIAKSYFALKFLTEKMITNIEAKETSSGLLNRILTWYDEDYLKELMTENT